MLQLESFQSKTTGKIKTIKYLSPKSNLSDCKPKLSFNEIAGKLLLRARPFRLESPSNPVRELNLTRRCQKKQISKYQEQAFPDKLQLPWWMLLEELKVSEVTMCCFCIDHGTARYAEEHSKLSAGLLKLFNLSKISTHKATESS